MLSKKYYDRILKPPASSFFLFGPRGVGKSTWARNHFKDAYRIDLLNEQLYQEYLTIPANFAAELTARENNSWVLVDEIQRIPNLLNEVHRFIEEKHIKFVLLGSSARKLKQYGTNLLAGRAIRKIMFPLLPQELGADYDLHKILEHGSLPIIWNSPDIKESLRAYVELYLKEEIKAEALVRNLPGFARFLPIAALFHGESISVSSIARDSGTARSTVSGFLEILEDTLMTIRLPGFEGKLRVRERKHPKLYWLDPGIVRAVKKQFGPIALEEKGALLEGWVLSLLRAYQDTFDLYDEIYYWSPVSSNSTEVDFLLERVGEYLAIEIKSADVFHSRFLTGLRAISCLKNLVRRLLIYTGDRVLKTEDGIEIWPLGYLLNAIQENRLWP